MSPISVATRKPPPTRKPTVAIVLPLVEFLVVGREGDGAANSSSSSGADSLAASLAIKDANSSSSSAGGGLTTKGFLHLGQGTRFPTAPRFFSFSAAWQLGHFTVI